MSLPPDLPENTVILRDADTARWLLFQHPREILQTRLPAEVPALLRAAEDATARGLHAAGCVAYEAAPAFDPSLAVRPDPDNASPLLWLGLYDAPRVIDPPPAPDSPADPDADLWTSSVTPDDYARAFAQIKHWIHEGDTYQVNLTYRLRRPFSGAPLPLFLRLAAAQKAPYAAFVSTPGWTLCSASPELFFALQGDRLESRPMKGTAPRGLTLAQDRDNAAALLASEKNRAENLMIVDMVRNDLGRVALPGTVNVPHLFTLEKYPTVWQLTSTVTAQTRASVADIFTALFPPASITGAPKARTMALIADIESTPRRAYTGAAGFIAPGRRAQFNVAIRTLLIDHARHTAEYGVGGGIVWDSACAAEQAECRTKTRVLGTALPPFSLLETLLWTPAERYTLLSRHLDRLRDTAEYFDFPCPLPDILRHLDALAASLPPAPHKIRLLLAQDGAVTLEADPLPPPPATPAPLNVALAASPIDRADPFLYHKTTHRAVYAAALAARPGFDDVILFNADGEITEATRFNVIADIDGTLCTPPVSCGLLPGTCRAHLLAQGTITERPLTADDLLRSPRILLANAVRGLLPATLARNVTVPR